MDIAQEQTNRLLSRTLLHGAEVLAQTKHPHLRWRLQDAIETLLRASFEGVPDPTVLAHLAKQLQRCLEELSLIGDASVQTLLLAERHALLLQLHLGSIKTQPTAGRVSRASVRSVSTRSNDTDAEPSGRTADTMQRVLECVRKEQPVQTRDVIAKCNGLSARTVKRRLKDLVDVGSVRRDVQDGVVRYLAA